MMMFNINKETSCPDFSLYFCGASHDDDKGMHYNKWNHDWDTHDDKQWNSMQYKCLHIFRRGICWVLLMLLWLTDANIEIWWLDKALKTIYDKQYDILISIPFPTGSF